MARYTLSFLLLSLSVLYVIGSVEGTCHRCSRTRAYVMAQCGQTRYPRVCVRTLMKHINSDNQSPQQLAQVALTVSLTQARTTRAYLTRLAAKLEGGKGPDCSAIRDCIDQINDSVAQLYQSLKEIRQISETGGVDDFLWHMSNVETWTSAALTDQTTCANGFPGSGHGRGIRAVVKGKVVDVAQATSNALALVNRFVTRHRFRDTNKP